MIQLQYILVHSIFAGLKMSLTGFIEVSTWDTPKPFTLVQITFVSLVSEAKATHFDCAGHYRLLCEYVPLFAT